MIETLRLGLVFSAWAALSFLPGCARNQPRVRVHGKVTVNGQALRAGKRKPGNAPGMMLGEQLHRLDQITLEQKESLSIVYYPMNETGGIDKYAEFFWASVTPDGDYEVLGKEGNGIPPGRYRISVVLPTAFTNVDKLKGAFGPDNSRILREVPREPRDQAINIDLAKPEG
jgi:hypothetical protein